MIRNWMKQGMLGVGACAMLALAVAATGCGASSGGDASGSNAESAPSEKVASKITPKLLAELDTDSKHIEVYEDLPGETVVSEEGTIGTESVLEGWIGQSTLTNMYKVLEPKLKAPLSAEALNSLAEADARAVTLNKAREARELQEGPSVPQMTLLGDQGPSGPNYYDYNGDSSWWRGNYCRPGTYCTVWNYWSHSGGMTNIANWQCSVMNAASFGTATLTMEALTCSGLFCFGDSWEVTHTNTIPARGIRVWYASNGNTVGRSCAGDGVGGTFVNVGFWWSTPAPPVQPKPPASCGAYIYRAQTNGCTNGDGSASSLKICADGCGSTPDQAQANAALSIETRVCIGDSPGCCNVTYDQNFNWCGY